jgi:uncharacterized repeat protein (TIGR01451 family)
MKSRWIILVVFVLLFVVFSLAFADGTETLGPPSIPIAAGNGLFAAGTGMAKQPGTIDVSVPGSAEIKQVLLYWEGMMRGNLPGDETILVNGTEVTGQLIGGPTQFNGEIYNSSFRADITDLGFVTVGDSTLSLEGLNFTSANDGAGVLVLYNVGDEPAQFQLRDGIDIAFTNWPEPRRSTELQTFNFTASDKQRAAQLSLFVASVSGDASGGGELRPSSIEVTTGGVTKLYSNQLDSNDGHEWDTFNELITIPAGADSLTVQIFSRDDLDSNNLPASLSWVTAALLLGVDPTPTPPGLEVSKSCTTPDVFVGDEMAFEITVTNTGKQDLVNVEVSDPQAGGNIAVIDRLPIGESETIPATLTATKAGVLTNTVSASGTNPSTGETVVSNTAESSCTAYALEITKDAQPTLNQGIRWEILKTVNGEKEITIPLFPGQVTPVNYEILVQRGTPPTYDRDWAVSGTISIKNPAPIDAHLNAVIDIIPDFYQYFPVIAIGPGVEMASAGQDQDNHTLPPGMSVPVDCPSLIVPAGQTLVCTYGPVDLSSGLTRTNTAIVELKNRVGGEFSGTTQFIGTAQIDFSEAEVIETFDEEATVSDEMLGFEETVKISELPKTFKYTRELPPSPPEECPSVINKATLITNDTGTRLESSARVFKYCFTSASTGFEDLPYEPGKPTGNDWDYNDAVIEVSFEPTFFSGSELESFTFNFVQPVNISGYTHEFHIQPDIFTCNGTYTLTRRGVAVPGATNAPYKNGQNLMILADTGLPDDCSPNTAKLVIEFDASSGPCQIDMNKLNEYDPFKTFNGEGLFYVPSLVVKPPNKDPYTIPNTGFGTPDPRIVSVPDFWDWPNERQPLWDVYPKTDPADPKGPPAFYPMWWEDYTGPGRNTNVCKLK